MSKTTANKALDIGSLVGALVLGFVGVWFGCAALKPSVKAADTALDQCVARAQQLGDVELEKVCRAGGGIVDVIDLFAARQGRDAGVE
jgi:hypothetical protein